MPAVAGGEGRQPGVEGMVAVTAPPPRGLPCHAAAGGCAAAAAAVARAAMLARRAWELGAMPNTVGGAGGGGARRGANSIPMSRSSTTSGGATPLLFQLRDGVMRAARRVSAVWCCVRATRRTGMARGATRSGLVPSAAAAAPPPGCRRAVQRA